MGAINELGLSGSRVTYWPVGGTMQSVAYLDHEKGSGVWTGYDKWSDERIQLLYAGHVWREVS